MDLRQLIFAIKCPTVVATWVKSQMRPQTLNVFEPMKLFAKTYTRQTIGYLSYSLIQYENTLDKNVLIWYSKFGPLNALIVKFSLRVFNWLSQAKFFENKVVGLSLQNTFSGNRKLLCQEIQNAKFWNRNCKELPLAQAVAVVTELASHSGSYSSNFADL